ncbi:uncharacterized protein LOC136073564 [Hydra vulgaris]|uniref:uncharacterized protein LOC136073564 n=1 Tax=Hydra vulgaris TaxID=6087 RepID=UPI0032EA6377
MWLYRNSLSRIVQQISKNIIFNRLNKQFATNSILLCKKTEIQDASKYLTSILSEYKTGCFFAGISQYCEEEDHDNVVMLHFSSDIFINPEVTMSKPNSLLNCLMLYNDVDAFMKNMKILSTLPVYVGEVDAIEQSQWSFGFTLFPFSIFSNNMFCCLLHESGLVVNVDGKSCKYDIEDIDYIGLHVSKSPFNRREIFVALKNEKKVPLISVQKSHDACDLEQLTLETEWMIKASALLCLNLTKKGNSRVHLRLSPFLQPENNEFVAKRQKLWNALIQRRTWEKEF